MSAIGDRYRGVVCPCGSAKEPNTFSCPPCTAENDARNAVRLHEQGRREAYCPDCYDQTRGGHIDWHCVNHPGMKWFGKNIPARNLFFDWRSSDNGRECDCTDRELRHKCPVTGKLWNMRGQEVTNG